MSYPDDDIATKPMGITLDFNKAFALEEQIRSTNERLARMTEVSDDVRQLVNDLASAMTELSEDDVVHIDPYLFSSLQQGIIRALRALGLSQRDQKRQLRVALEQIRQALRDIDEGVPVGDDRDAKDVARWLVSVVDVPQATLAELLGVDPRTLQRWISPTDDARPRSEQAIRLRIIARVVNHLRHILTGPGVIRWFMTPHPALKKRKPLEFVDRPDALRQLTRMATSARSSGAA